MTGIAISGYASLDHVMTLDGIPTPGRTTTILTRPGDAWPRLGGSPAYVAAALASGGIDGATPVTWIGDDLAGEDYLRQLEQRGIRTDGVSAIEGERTPMAILAYEPQGGCLCLYHPASAGHLVLTDSQRRVVAGADWLCVTVGPKAATREAVGLLSPAAKLCWVVKDDPRAVTPDLAAELAARADLICCSAAEAAFVRRAFEAGAKPKPGLMLIETRGGAGAQVTFEGVTTFVPSEPLVITDPTGAGDTFAGGALAALASGETDPIAVVKSGHKAAYALLTGRVANQNESA